MSNNNITSQDIIRIAKAIQMSTTLRLLDISHNDISICREVEAALSHHLKYSNIAIYVKFRRIMAHIRTSCGINTGSTDQVHSAVVTCRET